MIVKIFDWIDWNREIFIMNLKWTYHEQLQQQHQQKQHAFEPWSDASGEFGGVSICCWDCLLLLLFWLRLFVLISLAFDEFSLFECELILKDLKKKDKINARIKFSLCSYKKSIKTKTKLKLRIWVEQKIY